ncbi:hypothetical protein AAFF_G00178740 [Aldrovandia affinis]|uniref:Alcohol dehydrogenase-like C-terminal domain-containing protein n=1 Tax=Aldrovandia affinis TaxID=143900 RepID=A0AAD7RL45_9TELE|nr:hypothetical protein AAFF_G00178740 [Aldrovandia affinis]
MGIHMSDAERLVQELDSEFILPIGDTVIQNGANSAVGQAVIQISAAMGVRTINVIRDRPNRQDLVEELESMGADYVVTEEALQSPEMETVFKDVPKPKLGLNCVGGQSGGHLLSHLDNWATLVTYGGMSKKPLQIPAKSLIFKDITLRGFWMTQWKRNNREDLTHLVSMVNVLLHGEIWSALCPFLCPGPVRPLQTGPGSHSSPSSKETCASHVDPYVYIHKHT